MYLGIDVGGTKTLVAAFTKAGQKEKEIKFPTNKDYSAFIKEMESALQQFKEYHFEACCCAIPGKVDRERGVGIVFGNLPWRNVPIAEDLKRLLGGIKVYVKNDAKIAGLYQFYALEQFKKLLYIAPGTGVGIAFIKEGKIDMSDDDLGGRAFILDYEGQKIAWDDLSSGRAIYAKYGHKASEIDDPKVWKDYVKGLAQGLLILIKQKSPDVIAMGGGIGAHYEKFEKYLLEELNSHSGGEQIPPVVKAERAEEAVIYGCYHYAKSQT